MATYNAIQNLNSVAISDPYIVNLMTGYMPPGLVADQIFTKVPVSSNYGRIVAQNAPLSIEPAIELSPEGFRTITLNYTATDYFQLKNRGLQAFLSDTDIYQLGGEARARQLTYSILDTNIKLNREWGIASALTSTSTMTQNFNVPTQWDNYLSSDPIADFKKARAVVRGGILSSTGCGFAANTVIMGWNVFNALSSHPAIVRAYFQSALNEGNMTVDEKQLARVMKVDRVIVAQGRYDSAEKGQTKNLQDIWGNACIFCYINPSLSPNEAQQSLGYTFIPTAANGPAEFAYDWTTPGLLKDFGYHVVKGAKYDDHLTDVTAGCLLPNAVSGV